MSSLSMEIRTPSPPSTSSSPFLHAATIRPTAFAYFFPCSPSKTTPECRMIDGGVARDSTNIPKTVLCDESIWRVASSSGGVAAVCVVEDDPLTVVSAPGIVVACSPWVSEYRYLVDVSDGMNVPCSRWEVPSANKQNREVWTCPSSFAMPQPWRRSEIIEITDSDDSGDSGGEFFFSRNSQQLASQRTNASLLHERVKPMSLTVTGHTTRSQSVDLATGPSSQSLGLSPATASSSRSRTQIEGKGKAKEVTSIATHTSSQVSGGSSQLGANRLPHTLEKRSDDRCTFA
jgi:hypothetical protein